MKSPPQMSQERSYLRRTLNSSGAGHRYSREDKKILLHIEINMELVALCLKRTLEAKRKKQEGLRLRDTNIMKQITRSDAVFSLYD